MASLDNLLALLRECFYRVAGDEPGRLEIVLLEHVKNTRHADLTGEQAARYIGNRVFPPVGPEPASNGVNVHAEGTEGLFFWHFHGCLDVCGELAVKVVSQETGSASRS
jgi:hypothetical protein